MTKSVMITGASGGLGEGMARHFARRGYSLALTARDAAVLEPLRIELQAHAPQVVTRCGLRWYKNRVSSFAWILLTPPIALGLDEFD